MEPNNIENIKEVDLRSTMESSYTDYAMSVIVARALPDVRDGLKPVQRRILYAAMKMGAVATAKTKKCATIVGDTMGHYHPHGDSSIYGALVYMGQPWSLRYPLIEKQGNYGSEDGDSPAASRYTEGKLSKIAMDMLEGINKDTVDFVPNFSNEPGFEEPTILPARIPNILVNGTTGIAVGMATNIPPHNLRETINAAVRMIENRIDGRDTDISEIMEIVKGPDFPTGAQIIGRRGIYDAYTTGRGKIKMRAICEIVEKNGRQSIVVKELPYLVYRSNVIKTIADLHKEKKVDGIVDVCDIFGKGSTDKIRIDLRRDANPQVVLNQLYKHTQLQDTFGVIMLCIVNGEPKTLNLKEILTEYIKHQEDVTTRRIRFDLKKAEDRAHILEGYLKAIDNIDEVIEIIKASADTEEAKMRLMKRFDFSEVQAQAIVDMRLKALTGLERKKVEEELADLLGKIKEYRELLGDRNKLLAFIKGEMEEIAARYGDDRKTILSADEDDIEDEDLIPEADVVIAMTKKGYIKRMSLDNFRAQNRGGRGVKGMQVIEEDYTTFLRMTGTHDQVLFFTNQGRVYMLKAYEIPESQRTSRGTPIVNLIPLNGEEKVTAIVTQEKLNPDHYILMATKNGTIKKTPESEYENIRKTGLLAITLKDDDELIRVCETTGDREVLMVTEQGMTIRFNEKTVRTVGRTSIGVRGITLTEGDKLVSMEVSDPEKTVLFVSEKGLGKRTEIEAFRTQGRGGKGSRGYKITEKTGVLVGTESVLPTDELMLITTEGIVIRTNVESIPTIGKTTSGVKLMNVQGDAAVASFTVFKATNDEETEEGEAIEKDGNENE